MLHDIIKLGQQKLWTIHRENKRQEHKLTYLFWECTLNCNFYCDHCGSSAGSKIFPNQLTTEQIKKTFFEISQDFDARNIIIAVTGGEPLLRKDIFEVMSYAHALGFRWGMVTNGYLMNEAVVHNMRQSGMCTIDVSIDGIGDVHNNFRHVSHAYERAIPAVQLLAKVRFLDILRITTTIHQKNIHQLEEMYTLFSSLGITSWRLLSIEPIGRAMKNNHLLLSHDQLNQLLQFIKEKRKQQKKIQVSFGCNMFLGQEFEHEVRDYFFFCRTGINIASILYNGDIFVCPNVPRRKELIMGNVKQDRFSTVWNDTFDIFRNKNRTRCNECEICEYWNECLGGSLHSWDFEKGRPKTCFFGKI